MLSDEASPPAQARPGAAHRGQHRQAAGVAAAAVVLGFRHFTVEEPSPTLCVRPGGRFFLDVVETAQRKQIIAYV
jgi:hypothetical protein